MPQVSWIDWAHSKSYFSKKKKDWKKEDWFQEKNNHKKREENKIAFLNKRWAVKKNMGKVSEDFVSVKGAEKRWIKRKLKRIYRKKILAITGREK